MKVGLRIREERLAKGLTQKALSEKADISVSFLSDIESGRSNPSLERLQEISSALNCKISYLLDENSEEEDAWQELQLPYPETEPRLRTLLKKLLNDSDFHTILLEFEGFDQWSKKEKAELISFLRTKRQYSEQHKYSEY